MNNLILKIICNSSLYFTILDPIFKQARSFILIYSYENVNDWDEIFRNYILSTFGFSYFIQYNSDIEKYEYNLEFNNEVLYKKFIEEQDFYFKLIR